MPDRLIVRLPNWLGDTVMAVPALRALRTRRDAGPTVLAGPWAHLLAGQDLGDEVVTYPRGWRARLRAVRPLRAFGADTALLLPHSLESALAARAWGARRRVGFATGGRAWLLTHRLPPPSPRLHQVDEYRRVAAAIGGVSNDEVPLLTPPSPATPERGEVRRLLREAGVESGRRLIGIHLGAAFGAAKVWPLPRVSELCRTLGAVDAGPVLLGSPDDITAAETVRGDTGAPSLVGRDTPALLPALLAELDALVCGDTGVAHLAAALGTPAVTLFGPTDPALTAPRGRAAVLSHPVPCAPCFYRTCPIDHVCLAGITADAVLARLRVVLPVAS